jgi:hypothetical protein
MPGKRKRILAAAGGSGGGFFFVTAAGAWFCQCLLLLWMVKIVNDTGA